MLLKKSALLVLLFTLISSCEPKIASIGLDEKIRTYVDTLPDSTNSFKMDVFETLPFDWDHMVIVKPYTPSYTIRNLPYINLWPNKAEIIDLTYQEQFAQIVLAKGTTVFSVDTVNRVVIDFVTLKVTDRVDGIEILKRSQVRDLTYTKNLVTMGRFVPVLKAVNLDKY